MLFLLLANLYVAVAQPVVCHITGEVKDPAEKQVILHESNADPRINDYITVDIQNGRFSYDLNADMLKSYTIILRSEYERGSLRVADFIVENANIHITIPTRTEEADSRIKIKSDGKENAMLIRYAAYKDSLYSAYTPAFKKLEAKRDSLQMAKQYFQPMVYELYDKMKQASGSQRDSLNQLFPKDPFSASGTKTEADYASLMDDFHVELAKWFEANKCFFSLAEISKEAATRRYPRAQDTLADIFLKHYIDYMPEHPYHQQAAHGVTSARLQVGKPYIDYDVRGVDGTDVKLSSLYKGKIIFIDMWASWCAPCRRHAKDIIPIYEKYKDKGFQVIGIARENKMDAMEAAIKKDGYPWLNLLELKDQHHVWLKNGISNSGGGGFLIDEKGTILAVYPEADELERILKRLDHGE